MTILVTGAAGFIGYHVCRALLDRGESVVGVDVISDYYDVQLKRARLSQLDSFSGFSFEHADIADRESMESMVGRYKGLRRIVHLAAQAGVRYSLKNPFVYVKTNVQGHLVMLELCRHLDNVEHLVYASSSSVYGANSKIPFSTSDRVDSPISLYAATKAADELMSKCYSHLFDVPQTGLRFFTVYGPWGRPDMAIYIFTKAIINGQPIHLFNNGNMKRDFTYIDDVVRGVLAALDHPPNSIGSGNHQVYNLGNSRAETLVHLVSLLEQAIGKTADKVLEEMPAGDIQETFADIEASRRDLGYDPTISLEVGIPLFVQWYREYHGR
tara:strand:- start:3136 stop:4113 length:978 start_codon:yes stop_codon:yes gene_type:complete